jgi:hypothetical protein
MQSVASFLRAEDKAPAGPSPSFQRAHLLLAFMTIGESGTIGRQALAQRTGLGGGAVRTVLKKLRDDGYADANASGSYLTPAGKRTYGSIKLRLSTPAALEGSKLTVGARQFAVTVRGASKAVTTGISQRDAAIRLGADGATTFAIKRGRFTIPGGSSDCEKDFPNSAWAILRDTLRPKNGDAVVLCGAANETTAALGALSAALTLL